MSIQNLIRELDLLKLPLGQYAITNSATLAIRGLREANDIDIIVNESLWLRLAHIYKQFSAKEHESIVIGNVEILGKYLRVYNDIYATADQLIASAEYIDSYPFVKLEVIRDYKQKFAREKDLTDIILIDKYFKQLISIDGY
jgi:hypothetical protein